MIEFWEKCLIRTYHAFTHNYVAGREAVAWWLHEAIERDLLNCADLGEGSLAAVIATLPNNAARSAASAELRTRGLQAHNLGQAVVQFQRPAMDDWILSAVMDRDDMEKAALALAGLSFMYAGPLTEFFCRFYHIGVESAGRAAHELIVNTYRRWDYTQSRTFTASLFRRTLEAMPRVHPTAMPAHLPEWFNIITEAERTFLTRSIILERRERVTMFATIYAGLTATELAAAIHSPASRFAPRDIDRLVRHGWKQLFSVL